MSFDPHRYPDPAAGFHRITAERRFMYIQPDPEHTLRLVWQALPVTCPMCAVDTGLTLAYERGVHESVQVLCPAGHAWHEHLIDTTHFTTYSNLQFFADPDPEMLWITEAGFGEEPPPEIDYVADITKAAKYVTKYATRQAKGRMKRAVRTPLRKARRKALNLVFTPVAAALRGAWGWQVGELGEPAVAKAAGERARSEPELKIPPYSKYRKALGIPAPEKGPRCLVCEDSGRITAPGISITCTECPGPAATAMDAAARKAERARNGSGRTESGARSARTGRRTGDGRGKDRARRPSPPSRGSAGLQNAADTGAGQGGRQAVSASAGDGAGAGRRLTAEDVAAVRNAVSAAAHAVATADGKASSGVGRTAGDD